MKKSENKHIQDNEELSKQRPQTIDEFINQFPDHVKELLQKVRLTIKKAAPDAQEAIKYQMPTFVLHGNLVHFSAYEKHIGFYPAPSGIEHFKKELAAYKNAKGSVQFPLDNPIPYELISRVVEFRVRENCETMRSKTKKK